MAGLQSSDQLRHVLVDVTVVGGRAGAMSSEAGLRYCVIVRVLIEWI